MQYARYYNLYVERELRRIGVDLEQLGGLASAGGDLTPEDVLRWLRTVPAGTGHAAFMQLLVAPPSRGGPHTPPDGATEAPDVASHSDPEFDEQLAFLRELDRVVTWESIAREQSEPEAAFGVDMPHGRAHALAVLRTLPDGAGPSAFVAALHTAGVMPPPVSDR